MFLGYFRELVRPGSVDRTAPLALESSGEFVPPINLPTNRAGVRRIFGDPGFARPSKHFQRERMTTARNLPGGWNRGRGKLYCHELAEPFLREALTRAAQNGSLADVQRIGCYVHRHQRHDPRRPLSFHSWGIAIDIDPALNKSRKFGRGLKPEPFSEEWRAWWPLGLSRELVEAFESVGWRWGGRWERFVDPMHFELVAR